MAPFITTRNTGPKGMCSIRVCWTLFNLFLDFSTFVAIMSSWGLHVLLGCPLVWLTCGFQPMQILDKLWCGLSYLWPIQRHFLFITPIWIGVCTIIAYNWWADWRCLASILWVFSVVSIKMWILVEIWDLRLLWFKLRRRII